ncbi:hypothetical protein R75461_07658 [Paraburkholderia nemoris]|nr:hypothetical protein R75461_07658 [Paraburkholderia nemoris]
MGYQTVAGVARRLDTFVIYTRDGFVAEQK